MGYANDKGETLRSQLAAWIGILKSLPRARKTEYVAISGNHELNRKVGDQKLPSPAMDAVWSSLVKRASLVPAGYRSYARKLARGFAHYGSARSKLLIQPGPRPLYRPEHRHTRELEGWQDR